MKPIQHPLCNTVLGAPAGVTIEDCRALPIRRAHGLVTSYWQPTAAEIAAIAAGATVVAHMPDGAPIPPMRLEVIDS